MVDALDSKFDAFRFSGSSPLSSKPRAYNSMAECAAHNGNVGGSILSKLIIYIWGYSFSGKINALHALVKGSIPFISTNSLLEKFQWFGKFVC
jgi:hypothetical protein